jgi:WD40 repeat protein
VRVWDGADGTPVRVLTEGFGCAYSVTFNSDGSLLAAGTDHRVLLWETATWTRLRTLEGHTRAVVSVAFSPDGTRLASASEDGTIRLWE